MKFPHLRAFFCLLALAGCTVSRPECPANGQWLAPATLRAIPDPLPHAARQQVILLGEAHDSRADHEWQLATVSRLYDENPKLVLGFEMFPRAAQPVLDQWVAGTLSEAAFLQKSDWAHVWGFPPALYLPIFRFARDRQIPMLALNVSRRLVHLTATQGFASVPAGDREGIGVPAPPSDGYRATLADAMAGHGGPPMTQLRLGHFIDAQLLWDRAMAEGIATQHARAPDRPVVALMGEGHVQNRFGVPHQLDSLGLQGAVVLLSAHAACSGFSAAYADAIYADCHPRCLYRKSV